MHLTCASRDGTIGTIKKMVISYICQSLVQSISIIQIGGKWDDRIGFKANGNIVPRKWFILFK